jgi:hypothetical protein
MKLAHGIDPATGLLPETPNRSLPRSPFEAAATPGSGTITSHSPWREEELQAALVDWVIARDVSFATATWTGTRGLLTWQRNSLLHALPNSASTMSAYVRNSLVDRKAEIASLLRLATSKISVSVDIWTSSNYMSFLGVAAHFTGKRPGSTPARLSIRLWPTRRQLLVLASVSGNFKLTLQMLDINNRTYLLAFAIYMATILELSRPLLLSVCLTTSRLHQNSTVLWVITPPVTTLKPFWA